MLEIRNICKTYRAKSGVEVKALDNITLTFPDRGMVFLLGKSGSGKSTLLNVIGGLDSYDSGEFIIKGKSSDDFRGSDFDAYRNTFIGFIFQEYNILDEFSVGANIALALELQGKRASDEEVNSLLEQVDLVGFGKRKPNELSGGQKQRIAIARALIKDPQIIMADEPTGALDSNTGKQVFDTLKKLSQTKLVLVVSHDRDFAERYADRIIELSDGHIESDVTLEAPADEADRTAGMRVIGDSFIHIDRGYRLTPEDMEKINAYLAQSDRDILISKDEAANKEACNAAGIAAAGVMKEKKPTGKVKTEDYDGTKTKFIKSRLPARKAFRMGASSLKSKPVRLFFTILLSLVAFSLFGFADTFAAYDKMVTATDSVMDARQSSTAFGLVLRHTHTSYKDGEVDYTYTDYYQNDTFNDRDVAALKEQTGLTFYPVYNGGNGPDSSISLANHVKEPTKLENSMGYSLFTQKTSGLTELTAADCAELGFTVKGELPDAPNEIAITEYLYRTFRVGGFQSGSISIAPDTLTDTVGDANSILGQKLSVSFNGDTREFTVTGVVDTHFNYDAYPGLKWDAESNATVDRDKLKNDLEKVNSELKYGFHTLLIVADGVIDTLPQPGGTTVNKEWGNQFWNSQVMIGSTDAETSEFYHYGDASYMVGADNFPYFDILWADGSVSKETLEDRDFVISADLFYGILGDRSRYTVSPLPALRDMLIAGGEYGEDQRVSIWEHFITDQYQDPETGDMEDRYRYAERLGMTDGEYLTALTEALNTLYGLSLTEQEWMGIAGFSRVDWDLQIKNRNSFATPAFLKYAAEHYDELASDSGFAEYVQDREGKSLSEYIAQRESENPQLVRGDIISYAASYMQYVVNYARESGASSVAFGTDVTEMSRQESLKEFRSLSEDERTITVRRRNYETDTSRDSREVVNGIFYPKANANQEQCIISSRYYSAAADSRKESDNQYTYEDSYGEHESGKYAMVVCAMPSDEATVRRLIDMTYREEGDYVFKMQSYVLGSLEFANGMIESMNQVFIYIGIGFAVFAALMMFNFISVSITQKKKEIGILRAVGARSSDVFGIFFTEAFLIALINFFLALGATFGGVIALNNVFRSEMGLPLTLLHFGVRQALLLLAVSVVVAFISSFLPTYGIARKNPIDAMRDR